LTHMPGVFDSGEDMSDWDHWVITTDDRVKHDAQFQFLKPVGGYITGEQARVFFMKSGLSVMVLGQIWALADMDMDGKMDKKEFSIAMFLIKKTLEGLPLPCTLPSGLKNDPQPSFVTSGVTLALSLVSDSGHNRLSSMPSSNGQDSNISSTAYQDWVISPSNVHDTDYFSINMIETNVVISQVWKQEVFFYNMVFPIPYSLIFGILRI
ncbi:hypothetical protein MN116_001825, partial [Schistosoma mekongi]